MGRFGFAAVIFLAFVACASDPTPPPKMPEMPPAPELCTTPEVELDPFPVPSEDSRGRELLALRFRCQNAPSLGCHSYDDCKDKVETEIHYRYTVGEETWEGKWSAKSTKREVTSPLMSCEERERDELRCRFGTFGFEDHLVAEQQAHGHVDKPVGRLTLLEIRLTFPNGTSVELNPAVFPKIAKNFSQEAAFRLKPHAQLATSCKGRKPEDVLPLCDKPSEVAFLSQPGNVRALQQLNADLCRKRLENCEHSRACDDQGFVHGRENDYLAACWSGGGRRTICLKKREDDEAWTQANAAQCASPSRETDCAPLVRYVHLYERSFYTECEKLVPFHGFHEQAAQAALQQGIPLVEKLMVARVTGQCELPSTYDSCDELSKLRAVRPNDPRATDWDNVLKASRPKVEEFAWRAVGQGVRCARPVTSYDCDNLKVYLNRHADGKHASAARGILNASAKRIAELSLREAEARAAREAERAKWLQVCAAQCETTCSSWSDRSGCISRCESNCKDKIP